uniref:CRAL-TRIO domain-containing protein n=1 Tax=Steinernema glaseri TaxID=37863 RepID=A0A1I8AK61_9BILA
MAITKKNTTIESLARREDGNASEQGATGDTDVFYRQETGTVTDAYLENEYKRRQVENRLKAVNSLSPGQPQVQHETISLSKDEVCVGLSAVVIAISVCFTSLFAAFLVVACIEGVHTPYTARRKADLLSLLCALRSPTTPLSCSLRLPTTSWLSVTNGLSYVRCRWSCNVVPFYVVCSLITIVGPGSFLTRLWAQDPWPPLIRYMSNEVKKILNQEQDLTFLVFAPDAFRVFVNFGQFSSLFLSGSMPPTRRPKISPSTCHFTQISYTDGHQIWTCARAQYIGSVGIASRQGVTALKEFDGDIDQEFFFAFLLSSDEIESAPRTRRPHDALKRATRVAPNDKHPLNQLLVTPPLCMVKYMTVISTSISPEDGKKITELRALVKDDLTEYYDTDFNLLRWLQGHPGSVEEIARKLRKHLKMRRSYWDLDSYMERPRNHPVHNHWKYGFTGLSHVLENTIVNIEQAGETDYWGMIQTHSLHEIMKARTRDLEEVLAKCMALEAKTGKQASVLYVMDLTNLKYDKRLYSLLTGSMKSFTEFLALHYVELIQHFIVVNVPSCIYALWQLAKPLLPEKTRQKVRILSSSNWRQEILKLSDPSALPTKWNDSQVDVFKAEIDQPIPYPEQKYYVNKNPEVPEGCEKISIAPGKNLTITKELKEGDKLSWYFIGERDMGLGIFFTEHKDESDVESMDSVYPCFEWMPGPLVVPLAETITAKRSGFYKIWISNCRSWWHTLVVTAKITVASE